MKHIQTIIFRNFISPISIAIFILAGGLLLVGEVRDAWFISFVILVNSFIGTIQEVRAYLTLRKIELMSAPRAMVFRDGKLEEILFTELQNGDKIFLKTGDEIPADAKITKSNSFEVNESILTGESDAISKNVGDKILSSSIVVSGEAEAEVLAVGENTEAGQMAAKLKNYKPKLTPIQQKISKLISRLSWFALVLAIMICIVYFFIFKEDPTTVLKTITSAAVVVVPEGLLLASSLFFAYGSLKLLQAKVLPQKISAIEDMALLEVLATDKTGTLTSPEIKFNSCEVINKSFSKEEVSHILNTLNSESTEKNATSKAILDEFRHGGNLKITDYMAFSSSRKLSGMTFLNNKKEESIVFGAPEFILKNLSEDNEFKDISKNIDSLASQGLRVLLLAKFKKSGKISKLLNNEKLEPIAIITLKNALRPNVQETVDFLQNRGVSIRVISGDNPRTVSFIASEAGVKNAEKYITGAELANLSKKDFEKAVLENTIFARVLPEQKEKIIGVFQKNKLYTGMIGDGVNDALAIKKSDLGISMFDGAPATRRVADLVLMDNSFTSLPSGVKVGNRIMLSIEMIAILFFHKIILGVTILFTTMIAGVNYPFLPRHITYMNFILVTMPTVLTTLFPPIPKAKINPKNFWRDTLYSIMPVAILSGLAISFIYVSLYIKVGGDFASRPIMHGILATVVIATAWFGVFATILSEIFLGSKPSKNNKIRRSLYIIGTLIFTGVIFSTPILRDFFEFNLPNISQFWFVCAVIILVSVIQLFITSSRSKNK